MTAKKSKGTIYISNMSEDVWDFISQMSSSYTKESEIQENARLSEHDLISFVDYDNILIILPHRPNAIFLEYFQRLFPHKNLQILSTKIHTGEISFDIIHDPELLVQIFAFSKKYDEIRLISYTCSSQFLELSNFLSKKISNLLTSESPTLQDSWTVDFYGSKSGIRQFSQQSGASEPDFKMAQGVISFGIQNTVKIAANLYTKNGGIVIKTNKGHCGAGLMIIRPQDMSRNYEQCAQTIEQLLLKEKYWKLFPIVVEKYIEPNPLVGGGFPNVEFKIHKNGKVEFLYFCSCRLTSEGIFKGIEVHNTVLSDKVSAQLVDTGFYIGEMYAKKGYRGYFDVDFITSKNGAVYVTESNTRRTGGTHVYYLARNLFGPDFMYHVFTISNNLYSIPCKIPPTDSNLFDLLAPVLFNKKKKEGLVVTSVSLLDQNAFGYVIFSSTRNKAIKIEKKMEELLTL